MSGYHLKNPGSTAELAIDWSLSALGEGEEIEADLGWAVEPAQAGPDALLPVLSGMTATTTSVRLAGGRPGDAYMVESHVRTTAGRELRRALTVRVGDS